MKSSKQSVRLFLSLMLTLALLLPYPLQAAAEGPADTGTTMIFILNQDTYTVNGDMQFMDASPVSMDGRTMLPVVYVANPLGADVKWDQTTKKITIALGDTQLELWVGQSQAKINGVSTSIDPQNPEVKPMVLNGRTMLPMRFVAENLGCDVKWEQSSKKITIAQNDSGAQTAEDKAAADKAAADKAAADKAVADKAAADKAAADKAAADIAAADIAQLGSIRPPGEFKPRRPILLEQGSEAKAAEAAKKKYLIDLSIGMGKTGQEAKDDANLPKNGFTGTSKGSQSWTWVPTNTLSRHDPMDINEGADKSGSKHNYIYMQIGWNDDPTHSYTDLCVYDSGSKSYDKAGQNLDFDHYGTSKYYIWPMDLNSGAGGSSLYLMSTIDKYQSSRHPITDVLITSNPDLPGWETVRYAGSSERADLNKGISGAPPLYIAMKRDYDYKPALPPPPPTKPEEPKRSFDQIRDAWNKSSKGAISKVDPDEVVVGIVSAMGRGYDVFDKYGEISSAREPVLDVNQLLKDGLITRKNLRTSESKTIIESSLEEYGKSLSVQVGVEGGYGPFSASVNTSFDKSKRETYSTYFATRMHCLYKNEIYIEKLMDNNKYKTYLTDQARKDLNGNWAPKDLFDRYGQYVLTDAINGGRLNYNISTSSKGVKTKDDFQLKANAKFDAGIAKVSTSVSFKTEEERNQFDSNSKETGNTVGGDYTLNLDEYLNNSAKRQAWETALTETGTMVDFGNTNKRPLIPIWELCDNPARAKQLKDYYYHELNGLQTKLPKPEVEVKRYLDGIRLGRDDGGLEKAIKKATQDHLKDDEYGSHKFPYVAWELLLSSEKKDGSEERKIADLNLGTKKGDRIVLLLGWNDYIDGFLPITDICIMQGEQNKRWERDFNHFGVSPYFLLGGKDLNTGAGGEFLYLMWTRDPERPPITQLELCVGDPATLYPGWEVIRYAGTDTYANLNANIAGAPVIYLVMKRGR